MLFDLIRAEVKKRSRNLVLDNKHSFSSCDEDHLLLLIETAMFIGVIIVFEKETESVAEGPFYENHI